jgi:hypothetical protein
MRIVFTLEIIAAIAAISVLVYRKNKLQTKFLKVHSYRKHSNVEAYVNPHRSEF